MPKTKIILKDELADLFVGELVADVNSVREAVSCMEANFPAFRSHLARSHERGYAYEVYVGDWNIEEKHLHYPTGQQTITIAPVLMGAGNFGKIILGVGLLGLGLAGVGILGLSSSTLALVGGTMALSGILGLFNQPAAPNPNDDEKKPSLIFNGGQNTTAQGGRLPLVYGGCGYKSGVFDDGMLVGSQVLSASIRSWLVDDESLDEDG